MRRRDVIKGTIAAGAAATLPGKSFAQYNPTASRDQQLIAIAREQLARTGAKIWKRDIVGIADFGLHSSQRRFHFVDLVNERVASYHVSHGTGSDSEHEGRYGTSIRLDGLDPTNSNALPRAIVMHQANYATPEHVSRWGRLGRSNGCLAMGPIQFDRALIDLSGGRLVYAESLGLTATGTRVKPPVTQTELLRNDYGGTFERTNPGVY
ncbi:MAG: twin-arginine translocation pathway signal [Citromicrobium sp.]|nr:MAG: twin-arginine translocation pathway signal [Citromicrobium sp.]